jgi:hypothetical protein
LEQRDGVVRCPREHDPLMRPAGGLWDPGARHWLIEPRRLGPAIRALERTVDPLSRRVAAASGSGVAGAHRKSICSGAALASPATNAVGRSNPLSNRCKCHEWTRKSARAGNPHCTGISQNAARLQNTRKATTMPMMTRISEMPSTQRTTPAVSPCRAFVAASFGGGWSDMPSLKRIG